jgi:hypothetical protein
MSICMNISEHTEFHSKVLTLQLALRLKYLPYYSKRLIYITIVPSVMTRTATFHNNQSTSVPISVTYVEAKERNMATGTVRG